MSEIRSASPDSGMWEERLRSLTSGELTNLTVSKWEAESKLVDQKYEFENQSIIVGSFTYLESHPFNPENDRENEVRFMYREDSELFLIQTEREDEIKDEVIRKLNELLPDDAQIFPGISLPRKKVWDYVGAADTPGEVHVLHESSVVNVEELDINEDEKEELIVWEAELFFNNPHTGDEHRVIYSDDAIILPGITFDEIEYLIQLTEQILLT